MNARNPGTKLVIFLVVTGLVTAALVFVVGNIRLGPSTTYTAYFTSASGAKVGDDVKVAGVPVGKVSEVALGDSDSYTHISFTVSDDISVFAGSTVSVKYKNLIGDRYLELAVQPDGTEVRRPDEAIPVSHTAPALDIDVLVNGFRPLLQGLDPEETNRLSASIIEVLNGRQQSIGNLVEQLGTLGTSVADRDEIIGETIDNLNHVLGTVNSRRDQFGQLVSNLQSLTSGLNQDRESLTQALVRIDAASTRVADALERNRTSIQADISELGSTAANLNAQTDTLNMTLGKLPDMYRLVGRNTGYGSFLNFFVCGLAIRYPAAASAETTPMFTSPAERCR